MKRIFFTGILIVFSAAALQAQYYRNGHPFDQKRFNLGFLMGLNYNDYNLKQQVNVVERGDTLIGMELVPRPGINLGMIANFNLHRQISLRIIPTLSLEQRNFNFFISNGDYRETLARKVEAAYFDIPVMFQLKTGYFHRTRVYILTGGNLSFNLVSNARVERNPDLLKITPVNYGLTFGFGLNLYGDRVKLSPEFLYKLGLADVYVPRNTAFASAIARLSSQVIAINFNFE